MIYLLAFVPAWLWLHLAITNNHERFPLSGFLWPAGLAWFFVIKAQVVAINALFSVYVEDHL